LLLAVTNLNLLAIRIWRLPAIWDKDCCYINSFSFIKLLIKIAGVAGALSATAIACYANLLVVIV